MKSNAKKINSLLLCVMLSLIFLLLFTTKAHAATITVSSTDLNAGIPPVYASGDTIVVQGDGLNVTGWSTLRALTISFKLELPDQTLAIPHNAMINNTAMTSFYAPSITTIDDASSTTDGAFYKCTKLESIDLPSVTSVGKQAFYSCPLLDNISLPAANSIGERAFLGNTKLDTISLPVATSIGNNAFSTCYNLKTASMPAVTSIGNYAFFGNTKLKTINLPAVNSIGNYAFQNCSVLKSISMPVVNSIGNWTFEKCIALKDVNLPLVTSIGDSAFRSCTALESISLPTAASIGIRSFYLCNMLKSVDLPSIASIGNYAFQNCTALQDYILGPTPPSSIGTTVGQSSLSTPDYYTTGNITISPWASFNLDTVYHSPTLHDISSNAYALTPLTDTNMLKGASQSFSTTLTGSAIPSLYQNWILWEFQGTNVRSTVDANGNVTIDPDETNMTLTLKASVNIGGITTSQTAIITLFSTPPTPTPTVMPTSAPTTMPTSAPMPTQTITPVPTTTVVPTSTIMPTRSPNITTQIPNINNQNGIASIIHSSQTTTTPSPIIITIENEDVDEGTQSNYLNESNQEYIVPTTGSSTIRIIILISIGLLCTIFILIQ